MSEKNSFVLYNDYWDVFEILNEEELGKLFAAIYKFVLYEEDSDCLPDKVLVAFRMVKRNLVRDKEKYDKVCERNRKNAVKGGRPKSKEEQTDLIGNQKNRSLVYDAKKPDSDSDSESDSDDELDAAERSGAGILRSLTASMGTSSNKVHRS